MTAINKRLIYWVAGTITSFAGVVVVRTLTAAPPAQQEPAFLLGGYTLAVWGLFVITLGTRRKN